MGNDAFDGELTAVPAPDIVTGSMSGNAVILHLNASVLLNTFWSRAASEATETNSDKDVMNSRYHMRGSFLEAI